MKNIDLKFVEKQMNISLEKRDFNSFNKWFHIWDQEHERIQKKSWQDAMEKIDNLQKKFVKDMARIYS